MLVERTSVAKPQAIQTACRRVERRQILRERTRVELGAKQPLEADERENTLVVGPEVQVEVDEENGSALVGNGLQQVARHCRSRKVILCISLQIRNHVVRRIERSGGGLDDVPWSGVISITVCGSVFIL
jgi:hypothetical protein